MRAALLALLAVACGDKAGDEEGVVDADGDGHPAGEDCDDADPAVHPGATEVCNGVDDDCDTDIDEDAAGAPTSFRDADGDGWGDAAFPATGCEPRPGHVPQAGDCDDADADLHPGAQEVCDRDDVDEDCDGRADDADEDPAGRVPWWADADGDGHGDPGAELAACDRPDGHVDDDGDCDDTRADVSPSALEVCDPDDTDEDCDGTADDADDDVDGTTHSTFWTDADGDGFGDPATATQACDPAPDQVAEATDCDDTRADVSPAGSEVCDPDDADEDCDGLADDADSTVDATTRATWYRDEDGDGFGDADLPTWSCDTPAGFVADDTDCDDKRAAVNPTATETCTGRDDDCDGLVDDADSSLDLGTASTWYADADADGHGDAATWTVACAQPSGFVADDTDCDDDDAGANPGETEVCDEHEVDEDCDGYVDGDGYTDTASTTFGGTSDRWRSVGNGLYGNVYLALDNARIESAQAYGMGDSWYSALVWSVFEATTITGPYTEIATHNGRGFHRYNRWTWEDSGDLDADIVAGRYYWIGFSPSGWQPAALAYDGSPSFTASDVLQPQGYAIGSGSRPTWSSSLGTRLLFAQIVEVGPDTSNADEDGDGWSPFCGDCDDDDASVTPDTGCP